MRHQQPIRPNRGRYGPLMVLVSARILNRESAGSYISNTGRFTIIIFLSDNGRLTFNANSASSDLEAKIGTTILIGGAGVNKATLTHVFIGAALYQGILTMTPSIFNAVLKVDMSDVIRIIVSNGMILYALTRKTKVAK